MTCSLWRLPCPDLGPVLPGRVVAIRFPEYDRRGDAWPYHRRHVRTIHGAVTTLTRDPHAQHPAFALWLDPSSRQWWARLPESSARMVAERRFVHALGDRSTEIRTGPALATETPAPLREPCRVRVRAVSPVVIRANAGRLTRTECEAGNISSSLGSTLAPRLGLPILHRDLVPCRVAEDGSEPWSGRIDVPGRGKCVGGDGVIRGWTGTVTLECAPLTAWLLACAVALGLGGRTAFGFGRIAMEDA